MAYAMIDWHDFVVVQTVDFQPGDIGTVALGTVRSTVFRSASLPGLCTPKDVGARILLEAREAEKVR